MVAEGIVVVHTTVDTGYTGPHSETVTPSEIAAHAETKAQPGTALVPVQYLFAPQSSLDLDLSSSLS